MSVAAQRAMTMEEFLAWEEGQELRWEFDGFAPVAMTGGTAGHSAMHDHFVKNQEYRDTPSIQRYVIPEQDFVGATVFARAGHDWVGHVLSADALLVMPEIGIELPLAELYEGIDFGATQNTASAPTGG